MKASDARWPMAVRYSGFMRAMTKPPGSPFGSRMGRSSGMLHRLACSMVTPRRPKKRPASGLPMTSWDAPPGGASSQPRSASEVSSRASSVEKTMRPRASTTTAARRCGSCARRMPTRSISQGCPRCSIPRTISISRISVVSSARVSWSTTLASTPVTSRRASSMADRRSRSPSTTNSERKPIASMTPARMPSVRSRQGRDATRRKNRKRRASGFLRRPGSSCVASMPPNRPGRQCQGQSGRQPARRPLATAS